MDQKRYLLLRSYKQSVSEKQRLDDIMELAGKITTEFPELHVELTIFGPAVYVPADKKAVIIKIARSFSCDILDEETDQILELSN